MVGVRLGARSSQLGQLLRVRSGGGSGRSGRVTVRVTSSVYRDLKAGGRGRNIFLLGAFQVPEEFKFRHGTVTPVPGRHDDPGPVAGSPW